MNETKSGDAAAETGRKRDHPDRPHLASTEDGCGCAEVWEHLSENRDD